MSREALLVLLAVLLIATGVFFLRTPPKPTSSPEADILHKAELSSALLGTGSRATLVNLSITQANEAISQKQVIIFSKPDKILIAVAEPAGERLLALEGRLFYFSPTHGEVEELTDPKSRGASFAQSALSREEMGLGFQLTRHYTAQELGKAQLEDKEAVVWQLSAKQEGSSYPIAKLFMDSKTKIPLKIEFFSKAEELQRVVAFSEFAEFEKSLLANKIKVQEVPDGQSTEISVLSRKSQPLFDLLFAPEQLKNLQFELPKK